VAHGRRRGGAYSDALVTASVRAIRDQWRPDPAPEWVTAIPSGGRAASVVAFAELLAAALGLPYVASVTVAEGKPPQSEMQNSVLQLENARAKLGVDAAVVRSGAVLLVDDVVDSRWSMTVAGLLLRDAGSGPVFPFALADASRS
jgi:ATP-dependent DNA helicase RecQ